MERTLIIILAAFSFFALTCSGGRLVVVESEEPEVGSGEEGTICEINDDFNDLSTITDCWIFNHTLNEQDGILVDTETEGHLRIVDGELIIDNLNSDLIGDEAILMAKYIDGTVDFSASLAITSAIFDAMNPPMYLDGTYIMLAKDSATAFSLYIGSIDPDYPTTTYCYVFYTINNDWYYDQNLIYPCNFPITLKLNKDQNGVMASYIIGGGSEQEAEFAYQGDVFNQSALVVGFGASSAAGGEPLSVTIDSFTCDGCEVPQ